MGRNSIGKRFMKRVNNLACNSMIQRSFLNRSCSFSSMGKTMAASKYLIIATYYILSCPPFCSLTNSFEVFSEFLMNFIVKKFCKLI